MAAEGAPAGAGEGWPFPEGARAPGCPARCGARVPGARGTGPLCAAPRPGPRSPRGVAGGAGRRGSQHPGAPDAVRPGRERGVSCAGWDGGWDRGRRLHSGLVARTFDFSQDFEGKGVEVAQASALPREPNSASGFMGPLRLCSPPSPLPPQLSISASGRCFSFCLFFPPGMRASFLHANNYKCKLQSPPLITTPNTPSRLSALAPGVAVSLVVVAW